MNATSPESIDETATRAAALSEFIAAVRTRVNTLYFGCGVAAPGKSVVPNSRTPLTQTSPAAPRHPV